MKQEISSLDLHHLMKELKILETGKFEKIYEWGKEDFIFRIYTKEGKKFLRVSLPSLIFFTENNYEAPMKPPGYCEFLRKYLAGAIIEKVEQKGFERIINIHVSSKHGKMLLVLELFKPGNIILVKDGIVMSPLNRENYKDREVKAKAKYEYPPEQLDIKKNDFENIIKDSKKTLVKTLAIDLGLGGVYAEEILKRLNIEKEAKDFDTKKISKEIKNILDQKIQPFTIKNEAFPISMVTKQPENKTKTFSEAIDGITKPIKIEVKTENQVNKHEHILKSQTKRLKELEADIEKNKTTGEYIYEHYQELETILNKIKDLRKTKSLKEIKKELKEIKELNEKEKKVILEIK